MKPTKLITILAAASCLFIVGLILSLTTMLWMCGLLVTLLFSGRLYAMLQRAGLDAVRTVPAAGLVGAPLRVELTVRNRHPWPKLYLSAGDVLPAGFGANGGPLVPVYLAPFGSARASYEATPQVRGLHRIGPVRVESDDPLGFWSAQRLLPEHTEVLVYPQVVPLPPSLLPEMITGAPVPLDASGRRGDGSLFFGIRPYQRGDPLRRIHWRSSARIGELAVREMEQEEIPEVIVALETLDGSELGKPPHTSLEYGVTLAASIASLAVEQGAAVRFIAPGWTFAGGARGIGAQVLPAIMDVLARLRANGPQGLEQEILTHLAGISPGSCLVWITPRLGPPLLQSVEVLHSSRIQVIVLALDPASYGEPRGEAAGQFGERVRAVGGRFILFRSEDDPAAVFRSSAPGARR